MTRRSHLPADRAPTRRQSVQWIATAVASYATPTLAAGLRPRIELRPADVLEGDPVSIRLTGMPASALASVRVQSLRPVGAEARQLFESAAVFRADAAGRVDLATAAPVSGAYRGADLRGLFWSQRPQPDGRAQAAAESDSRLATLAANQQLITLSLGEAPVDRAVLTLSPSAPGLLRTAVRADALVGVYYVMPGLERRPALVVLGGAEGGLIFANLVGPMLASRGYAVLGLGYFSPAPEPIDGLPTALNRIPVELLERGRAWLARRPEADVSRLGVVGASKGGEFALVLASTYPWIRAAVAYVPSDLVWQGFAYGVSESAMGSSWTRGGEDLPFVPETGQRAEILRGRQPGAAPIELARVARANIAAATAQILAAAAIPVERSRAALLMIGGGDDRTGDSGASVTRLGARLRRAGYPRRFETLVYPAAGHGIVGTGWRPTTDHNTGVFNDGGGPEADARAQADSWPKVLRFLTTSLRA
jgi:dienelactone hydrolase